MTIKPATREAIPLMISLAGPSGCGKTYSALLMAAGMAGGGKVGLMDTELGRGSMYADDADIKAALPEGVYHVDELAAPFSPERYAQKITDFINFGVKVLIIDSATHEWSGLGGCIDIAENNKLRGMPNWMKAKMAHKRLMNLVTQSPMDIIFCLRAEEKAKPEEYYDEHGNKKTRFIDLGMIPIQEKNFMYEMTLSMLLSDPGNPGKPDITKCPKPLRHLFSGEQALITKDVGTKLRAWADGGAATDLSLRDLKRRCRDEAMKGSIALDDFFRSMNRADKDLIKKGTDEEFQTEIRALANEADRVAAESLETIQQKTTLFKEENNGKTA